MYKKEILSGVIGAVLGALIGGSIVYAVYVPGLKEANQDLESKMENARSLLVQDEEAYSISGSVEKVEDDVVFVRVDEGLFPLDDTPAVRRVVVTEDTSITTWRFKDSETLAEEIAEYERNRVNSPEEIEESLLEPITPSATETIILKAGDLRPGDRVVVDSASIKGEDEDLAMAGTYENIKFKEEFAASTISVTPESEPLEGEVAPEDELEEESETNI